MRILNLTIGFFTIFRKISKNPQNMVFSPYFQ